MKYIVRIKRQQSSASMPFWQTIEYCCEDAGGRTVATALADMNRMESLTDTEGNSVGEIGWECSCLQKKCGACAMVINGRPRLACDAFLKEFKTKRPIVIEPLRKFPVVRDLIVDRSAMQDKLKNIGAWLEGEAQRGIDAEQLYDASRCLQCGCCLEVCPNYCAQEPFAGAAGAVVSARLLGCADGEDRLRLKKSYDRFVYADCGKSLACQDICPAGIPMDRTLSSANVQVWRR